MFRELDQRYADGGIVILEWEPANGGVRIRFIDRVHPRGSFKYTIEPRYARRAFLNPHTLRHLALDTHSPRAVGPSGLRASANRLWSWIKGSFSAPPAGAFWDDWMGAWSPGDGSDNPSEQEPFK